MRFQNLIQIAKGLPEGEELPTQAEIVRNLEGAKWHLWHGCWYRSIDRLESLTLELAAFEGSEVACKLETKVNECIRYINKVRAFIVDYAMTIQSPPASWNPRSTRSSASGS